MNMPMCSQSSNWKLAEEGKSPEATNEPTFSTWDDVLGGKSNPRSTQVVNSEVN